MRIHLASTRVRRIRSVYPEISVYALQSGNFCIRCVSGYVWMLVSVYFCIRWRHSIRTILNAHALLTNRIRVDGRIRFLYATCGRRYFCIRIKKFADTKISGCVWTGPKAIRCKFVCHENVFCYLDFRSYLKGYYQKSLPFALKSIFTFQIHCKKHLIPTPKTTTKNRNR